MTKGLFLASLCFLLARAAYGASFYVDVASRGGPSDDAGPGTRERPWRTLNRAAGEREPCPQAGDTIWVRGGVYLEEVLLRRGGRAGRPLVIRAFPGEKPVIEGEGRRAQGIGLPQEGHADYVLIEGLILKNLGPGGDGIVAIGRTGVTLRGVEVAGARSGVVFQACARCRLLSSHIHHCETDLVRVDTACSDIVVADNHLHHNREGMGLSVYAPGDGVRGQGAVVSVERQGPGLARFTTKDLDLSRVREGTLKGQDETGSVENPGLVLFFADPDPGPDNPPLPGGRVRMEDGRRWFVLRSNPDWGGKPYSPDGKHGLFEVGKVDPQVLSRAKSVYVAYTFSPKVASRDIRVERNEVDHAAVQGIWVQRADGVLLRGNRTHHNGATGIQIESLCRHIWIEGNVSYANSVTYSHETGIWLDETVDAVVQNNRVFENQKGMGVTQCEWVIVRRNVLDNNRAQHATRDQEACRGNAGGFWFSGGRHAHLGAPPGAQHNAFVHNTLYGNGTEASSWGGIQHGLPGYPRIGRNLILNNLVQRSLGACVVSVGWVPAVLDGNLYDGTGSVKVLWREAGLETLYNLSKGQELAAYRRSTGQDLHSQVARAAFADAGTGDFRPAAGSMAVDRGQPLTRTTSAGTGTRIPVEDVRCFTAGFSTTQGRLLIPGDEVSVAGQRACVVTVDRFHRALGVSRSLRWRQGDPVSYAYQGAGPDVGAFETSARGQERQGGVRPAAADRRR